MNLKFHNLELNRYYMLEMYEATCDINKPDIPSSPKPWIAKIALIKKNHKDFEDIYDFGDNDLDYYSYNKKQFDDEIRIIKEITKDQNPEFFI